ncbi:MAG: NADH-quinone oxidoreductase subunit F [bacterium]|nr:NADH-quinone oxidoreductase subunit F [bacterium]
MSAMDERTRATVPERIRNAGGLAPGVARSVSKATGMPEAAVHGVASFYSLLARPQMSIRVCTGVSCRLAGADALLETARAEGLPAEACSCLAACDAAPAVLKDRRVLPQVELADLRATQGDWRNLEVQGTQRDGQWLGEIGQTEQERMGPVFNLAGVPDWSASSLQRARELGAENVLSALEEAGLQGRGGAGFPAHRKWRGMRVQPETTRYLVLNADESEPGTFKDRELLLRRPDLVLEGLAIAALCVEASDVYLYLRGEFELPQRILEDALTRFRGASDSIGLRFHLHGGHGGYICGEETALLEALEGKRGMPRQRPPLPIERGLFGKPTLVHNVETLACVPFIVREGGAAFRAQGRTGPGTKLYSVSGHVERPGVYELPLGICLDELVAAAGGYRGELRAFIPGGAASGLLPAEQRVRPLDFESLKQAGSALGSAGVVVLNRDVDLAEVVRDQLRFFEAESCGQCAPCRIGTHYLREAWDRFMDGDAAALTHVEDASWQMNEGSICGLGQTAALPLTSVLRHFEGDLSGDE